MGIWDLCLIFILCSVMGWVLETIYCSIGQRRFVNRGFLSGPYCPIYGTGAVVVLVLLLPLRAHPALVFTAGLAVCTAIEYIVSYVMELAFHNVWWDYSDKFLNLNGRVCLLYSLFWGALSLVLVYGLYPALSALIARIPESAHPWLACALLLLMLADAVHAVDAAARMARVLRELRRKTEDLRADLKAQQEKRLLLAQEAAARLEVGAAALLSEAAGRIRRRHRRLLDAFPTMRARRAEPDELLVRLRGLLAQRREKRK